MKTSSCGCFWGIVFALLCLPHVSFGAPPSITSQPTNQAVALGGTAVFRVTASGTQPLRYQWHFNGTNLVGRTVTLLTLTNAQPANAGAYSVTVTNLSGSATSSNAVLTVVMPPSITLQPVGCTNVAGTTASFTVATGGATPLGYRWKKNGSSLTDGGNVSGATTTNLTLSNVQDADSANYTVVVTNVAGSITSAPAILRVVDFPTITTQPTNQTVWAGSNAVFSLTTTGGTAPLSYQWHFNGTNLNGWTNTSLILTNVQVAQAGNYAVQVTNPAGFILSSNVVLTVKKSGPVLVCDEVDLQAAVAAGGTIPFGCDGVITLTKTLVVIQPTTIDGTGHAVTISGGNAVRLFSVSSGVTVSFINLTLANGYAAGSNGVAGPPVTDGQPGMGGAILNNGGTVALTGCTVVSNNAIGGAGYINSGLMSFSSVGGVGLGGAVYNLAGNLSVTNCSFSANGATGGAGGYWAGQGDAGGDACGGAIYSQGGSVVVQNSTFVSHTAKGGNPGYFGAAFPGQAGGGFGGAVWSSSATVNFYNATFVSNLVVGADLPWNGPSAGSGEGGAVFANGGVVNCFGCTFSTNTVIAGHKSRYGLNGLAQGGAIWSYAALSVSQCSFLGNQTANKGGGWIDYSGGESSGGAVFNGSTLSLSGSTFANNAVVGGVGGLLLGSTPLTGGLGRGVAVCCSGTLAATNCTFVANSATGGSALFSSSSSGSGGDGTGGGLFNNGTSTLVNLTFAANSALGGAGSAGLGSAPPPGPAGLALGGALCNSNGTVNLYNTIVAYSTSGSNCWGTVFDLGHNLSSDASAGFYAAGSLNNTDPKVGPLDDYGGPTLTLTLLTGSPAIDGGNTATAPATDQRGRSRPYSSASDIGAFESSAPFIVEGKISGSTDVVIFSAGTTNIAVTNAGAYWIRTLPAGGCVITPSNANYVFVPNTRSFTLGPDQLNADFQAYSWNTINVSSITNSTLHLIYAGTNGQTYRVLTTSNLTGPWLPVATNTLLASNYFDLFLPMTGGPLHLYRAVSP